MSHALENKPRLLLVEDDPTSAAFLQLGLEALPAQVDLAATVQSALRLAARYRYDVWLIDAHLPDGTGSDLLATLRHHHPSSKALAHTADSSPSFHQELVLAGFADVMVKPLDLSSLQTTIRRFLPPSKMVEPPQCEAETLPDWDQEQALTALHGKQEHVDALRKLFLSELPETCKIIQVASRSGDIDTLREQLHRLQASCGFVGAVRLAETVLRLREQPLSAEALKQFLDASTPLIAVSSRR